MDASSIVGTLISSTAITGLLAVVIIVFLVPEKIDQWRVLFFRFLNSFPKLHRRFDRRLVAASIQDSVNGACERINSESSEVIPHTLRIDWAKAREVESFLKRNEVIVRLHHSNDMAKNTASVAVQYVKQGFLPKAKIYLDDTLRAACEYVTIARILTHCRVPDSFEYFVDNELNSAIQEDPNLQADLEDLEELSDKGYFSYVFLREIKHTVLGISGLANRSTYQTEFREFKNFLYIIATKAIGEDVPLTFTGNKVKVAVVLVARTKIVDQFGADPYINRIATRVSEGFDYIYIFAFGENNIRLLEQVKMEVADRIVRIKNEFRLPRIDGQNDSRLIFAQSNSSFMKDQRIELEEVKDAVKGEVPEVNSGQIEIVAVARERGVHTKVAVQTNSDQSTVSNPAGVCIGQGGNRSKAITSRLGNNEYVEFVNWTQDNVDNLVNAISSLRQDQIDAIDIDEKELVATVTVGNKYFLGKAYGKGGVNLRLASRLVGFCIYVHQADSPKSLRVSEDPEKALEDLIKSTILEVREGDIRIVSCARIPGFASRTVFKWTDSNSTGSPSRVCGEYRTQIQARFGRERVYFHDWHDEPMQFVKICLFPLREESIDSFSMDWGEHEVRITIRDNVTINPIWKSKQHLDLTRKVTGWTIIVE